MIKFTNVNKVYKGGKPALQGIDFHLPAGEWHILPGIPVRGKARY